MGQPDLWEDFRAYKASAGAKPTYPDFKHSSLDLALWLNSAPRWVHEKLEKLEADFQAEALEEWPWMERVPLDEMSTPTRALTSSMKDQLWIALFDEPEDWLDFRDAKSCGAVKPKHPDFKPKDKYHHRTLNSLLSDNGALWLDDSATPGWVDKMLQEKPRVWEKEGGAMSRDEHRKFPNDPDDQDDLRVQKE